MHLVLAVVILLPLAATAQVTESLEVTLPTGKIVHFQTAEQKQKYEAARAAAAARGQQATKSDQAAASDSNKLPPLSSLGHTALDEQPRKNGIVNVMAPTFTAQYYMAAPETWVGKQVTLSVAYLTARNEGPRADGMRQLQAATWGIQPGVVDQNPGGSLTILATPDAALKLLNLCGSQLQFNSSGVKLSLIRGEFSVLVQSNGSSSSAKEYGLTVAK